MTKTNRTLAVIVLLLGTIGFGGYLALRSPISMPPENIVRTEEASPETQGIAVEKQSIAVKEQSTAGEEPVVIERRSDLIVDPYRQIKALGGVPGFDSAYANILDDQQSDDLRYWSAVVIGQTRNERSLPILLEALGDSNEAVRGGALVGLKYLRDPKAVPKITELLEYDTSPDIRQLALVSLVKTGDDSVGDILVRNANDLRQSPEIRMSSIQAIEHIRLEGAFEKLQPLLEDSNPDIRARTAIYLSQSAPTEMVPMLIQSLTSSDTGDIEKADIALRLQEVTGEDFGIGDPNNRYDPIAVQADHASEKARQWWSTNKDRFENSDQM